ncbi:hypothetical protein [Streptomyces sp. H27-S2]|uniref:hypothetical protein n=1 Tax=Streptomyces antarcticus TaxID=2996458 RepID=UPI00226E0786|nr:hypothetical protein [Streptomyces sp. H27-S2]MCY0951494.1 hypothetical protein [Streptomyces sp. H27-S2]
MEDAVAEALRDGGGEAIVRRRLYVAARTSPTAPNAEHVRLLERFPGASAGCWN